MAGQESAEALALQALSYLLGREELLSRFLAVTGAGAGDMRRGARDPLFLGAVLDFLLADEPLLVEFAAAHGLPPASLAAARAALPGGEAPHWT